MDCSTAREALSARLDGENTADLERRLDFHLQGCSACLAWSFNAADVTRRVRLQPVRPAPDLANRVVARVRSHDRRVDRWPPERSLLVGVGSLMLVYALPMVLPGLSGAGNLHLLREAGVTDLALAVGILYAAAQPWRAAGMLPVVLVLAVGLAVTGAADALSGRTSPLAESAHALAPIAALLLWRLRRRGPIWRLSPTGHALRAVDENRRSA